jgi:exodeoxyribonuclease VIII
MTDQNEANYFAIEALSASGCKHLLRSPAHYKNWRDNPVEPTAAMKLGTAVHGQILEPEKTHFIIQPPHIDRRTKAGREEFDALTEEAKRRGLPIIGYDDAIKAEAIRDAVYANPRAMELLIDAQTEVPVYWDSLEAKVKCKAKIDALRPDIETVIDIKTTRDASQGAFSRGIFNMFYHLQAAHYCEAYAHLNDGAFPKEFVFIAVETEAPYATALYRLTPSCIDLGMRMRNIAAERYKRAIETNVWSGYDEAEIISIEAPAWANRETNTATNEEWSIG